MFDFHPTGTKALELPQVEGNVAYRPLHGEEYPLVALHKTDDAESNVRSAEEALNRICVCSKQSSRIRHNRTWSVHRKTWKHDKFYAIYVKNYADYVWIHA